MPIKNPLHRFQPAPLYIVLILSICYFSVQLILSHFSHALTLLMASYHMLCNIFALAGSIVTIKHNELHNENERLYSEARMTLAPSVATKTTENCVIQGDTMVVQLPEDEARRTEIKRREEKTRNTFGWARIEVLTMLIVCITLASLSLSLLVEALQTLIHISHNDSMHYPVHVMIVGFVGLLLNGFTYLLIGGYTLHQGNFLHINPKGNVVVEPSNICVEANTLAKENGNNHNADLQLKEDLKAELGKVHYRTRREGSAEFLRDVSSTLFVIVCAIIVHHAVDKYHTAKFIDPVLSIFSCVLVVALSFPYMKESCLILLQTIPASIDMENFERTLVTKFPQIVSYHDLHIWQLSSHKFVATVHIIFQSPKLYAKTIEDVRSHFQDHSITQVTIQPEFQNPNASIMEGTTASTECLMQCQHPDCMDKVCCKDSYTDLREVSVCGEEGGSGKKSPKKHHHHHHGHDHDHSHGHGHNHSHKHENKSKHKGHKHPKDHKCSKEVSGNEEKMEITEQIVEKQEMEMSETKIITEETEKEPEVSKKHNKEIETTMENKTKLLTNKIEEEESKSDSMKSEESLESKDMPCETSTVKTDTSVTNETKTASKEASTSSCTENNKESTSDSNNTKC